MLGGRAEQAAYYPLRLLKAILHGIQLTRDQNKHVNNLLWDDWDVGLIMSAVPTENDDHNKPTHHQTTTDPNEPPHESDIPHVGGGKTHIRYDPVNFRDVYLDEYTRLPLPHKLVQAAIREELNYFNSVVWELADANKVLKEADAKIVRTRWVICNKGDEEHPDVRARLVACELNISNRRILC